MYCRNCGKELGEQDLFCSACGTKVITEISENEIETEDTVLKDENIAEEDNIKAEQEKSTKKGVSSIKTFLLLICIAITVVGIRYSSRMTKIEEEKRPTVRRIVSETAHKDNGSILYTIKYEYDSNGEEKNRISYDGIGNEDAKWLEYAYDQNEILKEYWTVEADGESTGYFRIYGDYEFKYDSLGNLVLWWFYDNNEMRIEKITYQYDNIEIEEEK